MQEEEPDPDTLEGVDPDSIDFSAIFPVTGNPAEPPARASPDDARASLVARAGSAVPPGERFIRQQEPVAEQPAAAAFAAEPEPPEPVQAAIPDPMFASAPDFAAEPEPPPVPANDATAEPTLNVPPVDPPGWFSPAEPADWQERERRGGRRTAMALAATVLLAVAGLWGYTEFVDDKPLIVAWDPSSSAYVTPPAAETPATVAAPALPPRPRAEPPPLVLADPEPQPGNPAAATPAPALAMAQPEAAAKPPAAPAPEPEKAEKVKEKEVTKPESAPKPAKPAAKPRAQAAPVAARTKATQAAPKPAARTRPAPVKEASAGTAALSPEEELLRQCRAIGYHADQCVKRGCTVTKFGLACRGGTARR